MTADKDLWDLFEELVAAGEMPVRVDPFFSTAPKGRPLNWSRVEGMLLGVAIGDALGNTTESMTPGERRSQYGEIRDYLPNRYAQDLPKGVPSDDTQLTFWTVERLVNDRGIDLDAIARTMAERSIFGIGSTVLEFRSHIRDGVHWRRAAPRSAGNGALMRIAPALLPHLQCPSRALWRDAALLCRLTHHDAAAVASAVAFVALLWDLMSRECPPDPEWWLESYLDALEQLDSGEAYTPRSGPYVATDTFSALVGERFRDARRGRWNTLTACQRFRSGAYLLETVPCALWVLSRYGHDPEEAIVRAVNDTKDNDTVAAIVGAAIGALHGVAALPERWRSGLTGRTSTKDDGAIFGLLEAARLEFGF